MTKIDRLAEKLRQEPYHALQMRYNCIGKSFRFRKECRSLGIEARVVIALCYAKQWGIYILRIHSWGEIEGKRIELARPLNSPNFWGIMDKDIKPIIGIWI